MLEVRLLWILVLGTITLTLHGLIIDDWTTDRDQKRTIEIISWVLTGLLVIPTITALVHHQPLDGFVWAVLTGTAGAIALAANPMFDPVLIAIIWSICIIIVGTCGTIAISHMVKLDVRTFLYIMGVMISIGGGVLFSITHDTTIAAVGFLVILWVITIIFAVYTHHTTARMSSRTPIILSIIIATGLTIGVSVALLEHHTFVILVLGWIFQFIMWAGWVIITVTKQHMVRGRLGLVFIIVFCIVDRIYKHADVIFRVACKLCTPPSYAHAWALIYIQTHAEDVATRFEKMRTQL